MTTKHTPTPGPWEAVLTDDPRGQPQVMYRGLICTVEHSPDGYKAVVSDGRTVSPDEWEANTRLIAQAPDLLDLLTLALPYVETAACDPGYDKAAVTRLASRIRDTLSKAEGK